MKKELVLFAFMTILLASFSSAGIPNEGAIKINEFTTDPQTNWDSSGSIGTSDEFFEFYNPEVSAIDLTGWNLSLEDTSVVIYTFNETIPALGYLTILDPPGSQSNDGRIMLFDTNGTLVDSVVYGDFDDDGNQSNNAPDGNAADEFDECLARTPNAQDTDQDHKDFTKTKCTFNSENNFTFIPVTVTDQPASPLCALETDNVTLSAFINGSVDFVVLEINYDGNWEQINFNKTENEFYQYIVPSSLLSNTDDLDWRFKAWDLQEQWNVGLLNQLDIKATTTLEISPNEPDGQNGWYVSEPDFSFDNPDATDISYRWNGEIFTIAPGVSFGLGGTPNSGNITGGVHALHFASDVCEEGEQEFMGKFDFRNPQIKNLFPAKNDQEFNVPNLTISAYIDEVFQSNSGVNLSSITMEIDSNPVIPIIEQQGIDALVSYAGDLSDGFHQVEIHVSDNAGRESLEIWSFELLSVSDFELTLVKPTSGTYTERRIQFNISLTREAEIIEYMNTLDNNPRWRRLCINCDSWGFDRKRTISLLEGENQVVIRAIDPLGNIDSETVNITIDSRDPKIRKTAPTGEIASGFFEVEFVEENPQSLVLHYGQEGNMQTRALDIQNDCTLDRNYKCLTYIDLTPLDQQEIEYFFVLEDIAQNVDTSRARSLLVDMSFPIIESFAYEVNAKKVTFTLEINETTLDEITYIDFMDTVPREKRLCTRLTDGICEKTITVQDGFHNMTITVYDEAGNTAQAFAYFFTDSKEPRIRRTNPRAGFAPGLFNIEFDEENPSELILYYGNFAETRSKTLNLNECVYDRNTFCETSVDLINFEGEDIEYYFTLEDTVGNFKASKTIELEVDSTAPGLNTFEHTIDGKTVDFFFDLEEPNLHRVEYFDQFDTNPRYKTLCTRLTDFGTCSKTIRFKTGPHKLDIRATDKAGNEALLVEDLELQII